MLAFLGRGACEITPFLVRVMPPPTGFDEFWLRDGGFGGLQLNVGL